MAETEQAEAERHADLIEADALEWALKLIDANDRKYVESRIARLRERTSS